MSFKLYEYELADLVEIKYGKNQKKVEDENGAYPILGTGGVMGYANEYLYDKPSVLIGRKGSISKVKYIDEPFWTVDTLFYTKVNEDLVIPKYLYYVLSVIDFNYYNEGTTIPSLRTDTLNSIVVSIPNLEIQKRQLKILGILEEKLKVNEKLIKNLETLSQQLFRRWFIDFEFPNEQGLPYRSSGGEMVESELGEIPKGWEVKKLNYLAEIIMGQSPKGTSYNFEFEGLPLVNGASDFKGGEINPSKYTTEPKKISQKGDYIFGVRATLGNVTETHGEYAIGRGAGIARSKEPYFKEFLYFQLINAFDSFEHTASGSVYLNISKNDLNDYKMVVPTNVLLQKFNETTSAMLKKKEELIQENINLKTLRDTLLPKLLSGEIEIPDESVVERS